MSLIEKDLSDFPEKCKDFFGYNYEASKRPGSGINWLIIDTLAKDIINNSYGKDEIAFSPEALSHIKECKDYNYKRIYNNGLLLKEKKKIERMYELMFDQYLSDLISENNDSLIYEQMINLDWVSKDYLSSSLPAEKVRDFLAGMTDRYFEHVFKQITNPQRVNDFNAQKQFRAGMDK